MTLAVRRHTRAFGSTRRQLSACRQAGEDGRAELCAFCTSDVYVDVLGCGHSRGWPDATRDKTSYTLLGT